MTTLHWECYHVAHRSAKVLSDRPLLWILQVCHLYRTTLDRFSLLRLPPLLRRAVVIAAGAATLRRTSFQDRDEQLFLSPSRFPQLLGSQPLSNLLSYLRHDFEESTQCKHYIDCNDECRERGNSICLCGICLWLIHYTKRQSHGY